MPNVPAIEGAVVPSFPDHGPNNIFRHCVTAHEAIIEIYSGARTVMANVV